MLATLMRLSGCLGLILCLTSLGCAPALSGADKNHLEHHVPDHKPATFDAAVQQVGLRHERLAEEFDSADADLLDRELTELRDIVGWITEFAADSPLKKAQWDQVNAASKELLAIDQQIALAASRNPRGKWPVEASRVKKVMETLTTLVPFASDQP